MAVQITSAYAGEALEQMLVRASTGNELVSRGLIKVVPDISSKKALPRLKVGQMLQKTKEDPEKSDSHGDFTIDERNLVPVEFMAFTLFNPNAYSHIWRKWQPTGELVFAELPATAQSAMLSEMAKAVDFELGGHLINGEFAETGDDKLFNGILFRIKSDVDTIKIAAPAALSESNIIANMGKVHAKIPKALRKHPGLRILMSVEDFDKYDSAVTALTSKGADPTGMNTPRFKGIPIEALADMPEHVIVATIATNGMDSNLWMGVGNISDSTTVKIGLYSNAGELYFFKMKMKVDTAIAWGDQTVLYDGRTAS